MTYDLGATHARLKAFLSSPTPSARYVLFKGMIHSNLVFVGYLTPSPPLSLL